MENKVNEKKNGLAIAGFVCSICGFVTCGISSIIGFILSIIGLTKSKEYNGNGKGLSIAGIIIGGIFVLMYISLFGLGIIGSDESSNNTKEEQSSQTVTTEPLVLLDGHSGYFSDWTYYIEGYVQNNTDKEYSYVHVEFNLYDKDGAILGTADDYIDALEANGKWKFKATAWLGSDQEKKVASYKLKEITSW